MTLPLLDWDNPWIVGVVTGGIVIIAQYIWTAILESKRWRFARTELPLRTVEKMKGLSKAIAEAMEERNGMLFLKDEIEKALENIRSEGDTFVTYMAIYSNALPDSRTALIAQIADRVQLASIYARQSAAAWPALRDRDIADVFSSEIARFLINDIGTIKEDRRVFDGSDVNKAWKEFGQNLFVCLSHLIKAIETSEPLQREVHKGNRRFEQISQHDNPYKVLDSLISNAKKIKYYVDLIDQAKLNRLKLAESGGPA